MSDSTFGFIGLGLIGGSIARGLRRAYYDHGLYADPLKARASKEGRDH